MEILQMANGVSVNLDDWNDMWTYLANELQGKSSRTWAVFSRLKEQSVSKKDNEIIVKQAMSLNNETVEALRSIIYLTHPTVSDLEMNQVTARQVEVCEKLFPKTGTK